MALGEKGMQLHILTHVCHSYYIHNVTFIDTVNALQLVQTLCSQLVEIVLFFPEVIYSHLTIWSDLWYVTNSFKVTKSQIARNKGGSPCFETMRQ